MTTELVMRRGLVCQEFPPKGRPLGPVRLALDESVAESRWVSFTVPLGQEGRMRSRVASAASRAGYECHIKVYPPEVRTGNRRDGTLAYVPDQTRRIVEFIARVRPPEVGGM